LVLYYCLCALYVGQHIACMCDRATCLLAWCKTWYKFPSEDICSWGSAQLSHHFQELGFILDVAKC
jgi:hypothetical protein